METSLTKQQTDIIASIVLNGDISKLSSDQRVSYIKQVCDRLGIDWSTQPFQILRLNGKEKLYATKDATEQLRKIHGVSIYKLDNKVENGLVIFTAYAKDKEGKEDASTGAVAIEGMKGEALANAIMKAETKSKRRVTLSICGLGMLDESELESIPNHEVKEIQVVSEVSLEELHNDYMILLTELTHMVGAKEAAKYDPDNWKTERTIKAYQLAIPALQSKIKTLTEKEVVNG